MRRFDALVLFLIVAASAGIIGYALGTVRYLDGKNMAPPSGKEVVMRLFQSWTLQEQQDFILAAVSGKPALRREIAEDWCAINKKTQRVCWNARMLHPIRGIK